MSKSKVLYGVLIFFILYLIFTDASGAGRSANAFFGFIGDGVKSFLEFVDAAFDKSEPQPATAVVFATPTVEATAIPAPTATLVPTTTAAVLPTATPVVLPTSTPAP